ncbi:hypothetical protein [Amycolatopsis sp. Hca4]|uniref:hypothetical protein n=1 Tax=Amycolatopsis sp. Hca4 TaxID=2742131 RepID=UPI001C3768BA|nr:hypothetical protein [Amycolatopsis sp. Hca4]
MNIETLMTKLAQAGITTVIKADDERWAEGTRAWTVILSGAALGDQGAIRTESSDLPSGLRNVLGRLAARPGNWSWLTEFTSPRRAESR